ncbi:hypothetical protein EVAR_75807_1 [Eumeta japonica]|uniref:Nucleic-acid-binding protein from transposon X-element n=1 Tax=Eumeta variegata TaxID=151549 RepID=A0A4C1TD40_EUMVA|nr:hypothetical protein EVAR_75807_1 [Eumeta japonica]
MDQDSPAPWGGRSGPKTPITLELIQQVLTKALSDIGYEAPQDVVARDQPEMDIDPSSAPTSRANDAKPSPAAVQQTQTTSTASVELTRNPVSASTQAVTAKTAPRTGAKPTAPPRPKLPPPIFCAKALTSSNIRRLHPLNKYLVDFKVQFHTYALEEERKLKAVIRGIPTDFPVDEIQADLCGQGFCALGAQTLPQRRLTIIAVLAVLPRTEEAKNIFNNLNMVCGLSECPRTRESGEKPSCVNCLQQHTANYRGCPKAPKFISYNRPNPNRPKSRPVAPPRDIINFPNLAGNKPTPPAAASRPVSNPWGKPKPTLPPRAAPGPSGEAVRREPPVSLPASATAGTTSFGDDIQTVMSILRAVKSSEISEFARDFRACSNVEEKLMVLVRYHHLMVKLESI